MRKPTPPLAELINMTPDEVLEWSLNPLSAAASTDTGRRWQRQLAYCEPIDDPKALARTIWRHIRCVEVNGFGKEFELTGYTRRHICLKNLGHDPSRPSIAADLSAIDSEWVDCVAEGGR